MVPLCLKWCIWRERNAKSFEDCEKPVLELNVDMFRSLYAWMAAYHGPHFTNFTEFLYLCSFSPKLEVSFLYFLCT
jgi:hypothetical protein